MNDDEDAGRVRELLVRLSAESGKPIPTSALGRLHRTTTALVRTGAGVALGRVRGREGMDAQVIQGLILSGACRRARPWVRA